MLQNTCSQSVIHATPVPICMALHPMKFSQICQDFGQQIFDQVLPTTHWSHAWWSQQHESNTNINVLLRRKFQVNKTFSKIEPVHGII